MKKAILSLIFSVILLFVSSTVIAQTEGVILPDSASFCEGDSIELDAGSYLSYNWSTGDTSQSIFVSVTGNYSVTVTDSNGTSIDSVWAYEILKPIAFFNDSVDHYTVVFTNMSQYADSFLWDFGDGTISNVKHPTHIYPWSTDIVICHNVTLVAYSSCGVDSFSQINYISTIGSYTPEFNVQVTGFSATFSYTDFNPTSYAWAFGDGDSSTVANPTHTYLPTGAYECYQVTLIVENDCGSEYIYKTIAVGNYPANDPCNLINGIQSSLISASSIEIYPNPNNGVFNVVVKTDDAAELSIQVLDARGSLVYTNSFGTVSGEVNRTINLEGAAQGIYFVKVTLDGATAVYKLSVN